MRIFARVLMCVFAALLLAGCDPVSLGVGTKLSTDDLKSQTDTLDSYVDDICKQAGLADGACTIDQFSPTIWKLFVLAGMNDIDRRCDAYLTWLDDFKRSQKPILSQISQTRTVTEALLRAGSVHETPITVVGLAFGLASDTFTNVSDRLILTLPQSTVQAVVLSRQKDYRENLFGTPTKRTEVQISSRPMAIYALRSYLRLCMPMTIETEVNNTVAAFERGDGSALKKDALISANTVGIARITNPDAPTPKGPVGQKPLPGDTRYGAVEPRIQPDTVRTYQRALCVTDDGMLGAKGSITRKAISEYLNAIREPDTSEQFDNKTAIYLGRAVRSVRNCKPKYYNAFEVGTYGVFPSRVSDLQSNLAEKLKAMGSKTEVPTAGQFTADADKDPTRDAIAEFRVRLLGQTEPTKQEIADPKNRQLDPSFNRAIYSRKK